MQEGSLRGFARPQALTCQGRRRSAAAAHAKGPARPVMQSAFRAKGLWRRDPQIFKFLAYIATFFSKPVLRRPRPRPRRLAPLRSPSLRSAAKRAPRRATKTILICKSLTITTIILFSRHVRNSWSAEK